MAESANEIIKRINLTSTDAYEFLRSETEKLQKKVSKDFHLLIDISNNYKKQIELSKNEWKAIKEEISLLDSNRDQLKEKEKKVNNKLIEVDREAGSLASLHQVLDNRRKVLDEREEKIANQEKRLKRRFK